MKRFAILFMGILLMGCSAKKRPYLQQASPNAPIVKDATMVLCLIPENELRTSFENELTEQLIFHGVHAEASTKYMPEVLDKTSGSKKKLLSLIDSLPEKGFNQLLISAVTSIEESETDAAGESGNFELYHFETNLFSVNEEGSDLMWSMCICIYDYQFPFLTARDFATAIVGKLIEDGLIKENEIRDFKLYTL
ncbi:hypothetical protein [Spongiivirga citrea]|uniref:Uncharacterized protein n=1 Tax=Spongiivirga citrea TaxID=1481457 RepID=A0A6M0CLF8_9FLAO|nr:hypothetical protein [Spongiivirga citrea]NER16844.1 hypothetical protein [Spongiivirga citrea]